MEFLIFLFLCEKNLYFWKIIDKILSIIIMAYSKL